MVRIINGRFHQGQMTSSAAGYQCTAISLVVILLTKSSFGTDVDEVRERPEEMPERNSSLEYPRHSRYASYGSRLLSFETWGRIVSMYSPKDFAEAGLFRTGEADECACFHCGNLICGWEYDDNPMEQHTRCSIDCKFLNGALNTPVVEKKAEILCVSFWRYVYSPSCLTELPYIRTVLPTDCWKGFATIRREIMASVKSTEACVSEFTSDLCSVYEARNGLGKSQNTKTLDVRLQMPGGRSGRRVKPPVINSLNAATYEVGTKNKSKKEDAEAEIQELEHLLMCKVCLDKDSCIVFFPCRHMATCESCEGFLQRCPVCRSQINEAVKINED